MKTIANIATQPKRTRSLELMLDSVIDQFDEVNIYLNNFKEEPKFLRKKKVNFVFGDDLADNGKFYFVKKCKPGDVYFTLDDDIYYSKDYVSQTLGKLQKHEGAVVTYHGRKLSSKGVPYYTGHKKAFLYSGAVYEDQKIDVCGTGCSAFVLTKEFFPALLFGHIHQKMSDLIFSLECAKAGKPIVVCQHDFGWLQPVTRENGIQHEFQNKETPIQNKIADQIYSLNYGH